MAAKESEYGRPPRYGEKTGPRETAKALGQDAPPRPVAPAEKK